MDGKARYFDITDPFNPVYLHLVWHYSY
jgi:hypothetical protein